MNRSPHRSPSILGAAFLVSAATLACGHVCAQEPAPSTPAEKSAAKSTAPSAAASAADLHAQAQAWHVRNGPRVERDWGIDIIGVHLTSSRWMLEFKYRVVDPAKARVLLAHGVKPYLTDEASGAKLAVPAMENVGELRQSAAPEENRNYFIIFGNADRIVAPGSRVTVDVGSLHVDGMVVE